MKKSAKKLVTTLLLGLAVAVLVLQSGSRPSQAVLGAAQVGRWLDSPEPALMALPAPAPAPRPQVQAADPIPIPEPEPELPEAFTLGVENILQHPELRNGCEATSLAIVLGWLGHPADKADLAYNYIPREDFRWENDRYTGGDPELVYPGDPATTEGYYCFPGAVVTGANRYLRQQASVLRARNITGADEKALLEHLVQGWPVMLWVTTDGQPPTAAWNAAWTLSGTDEHYVPYINLHVLVLQGYDAENFYLCDPLGAREAVPRAELMAVYEAMGSRAVVVR